MILPKKSSGISLPCQTLRRSPSCPLAAEAPHAVSVTFTSPHCQTIPVPFLHPKRAHPMANSTETRSQITIPPLALPKSGTVEDLSSSQPVTQAPAGSFFSVFQYSTHLSRCQTSLPGRKNPGIYHNKSYFEISSIRRSSSAVNGAQWIAFTLSRICCGLEAPIRTLVTSLC